METLPCSDSRMPMAFDYAIFASGVEAFSAMRAEFADGIDCLSEQRRCMQDMLRRHPSRTRFALVTVTTGLLSIIRGLNVFLCVMGGIHAHPNTRLWVQSTISGLLVDCHRFCFIVTDLIQMLEASRGAMLSEPPNLMSQSQSMTESCTIETRQASESISTMVSDSTSAFAELTPVAHHDS